MWERTLQDLIRGLRANKVDEAKFISQAVEEIRQEIRSKDMELKAGAVLKLTYLDMMGYDMSWASFHVVEVMSSPKTHLKTIGYLAATQTFEQETDVLMLTTNLLKKDLGSKPVDEAVTLNGLSHIITHDLARDLSQDIIAMLNHSRPQIRKRAILVMYKVLIKYPEVSPLGMERLKEKLEDSDASVVAAAVNVFCELARQNPTDYLDLAPQLFHLLTTSSNNWMLIKIIKLFGHLAPCEPRLVRKLQPPITKLISDTPAISLLYECVHTCIIGGMLQRTTEAPNGLAVTCVNKLASFLQDSDQNLKYIALLAMAKIVPTHADLVSEYQDVILASIDDQDISIRMGALDLVSAMVNQANLQPIIQQLLSHLVRTDTTTPSAVDTLSHYASQPTVSKPLTATTQSPAYRLTLAQRILSLCARDMYENITDFEWYLSVLVDLAYVAGADVGVLIRDQLVDVAGRVRGARRYAVQLMVKLLCDDSFLLHAPEQGSCAEVLWAAAFICGEYCGELAEPQKLLVYLLQSKVLTLEPEIVAVYIQAATKVFGCWAAELAERWDDEDLSKVKSTVDTVIEQLGEFVASTDIDVQERAANALQLFTFIHADLSVFRPRADTDFTYEEAGSSSFESSSASEVHFPKSLFLIRPLSGAYELNTVASDAQARVPMPEGLDLDAWIAAPPPELTGYGPEEGGVSRVSKSKKGKARDASAPRIKGKKKDHQGTGTITHYVQEAETDEERAERERRKAERLERLKDDPYYLVDDRPATSTKPVIDDVDSIPVVRLDDLPPLRQGTLADPRPSLLRSNVPMTSAPTFVIDKVGEMPEGAVPVQTPAPQPSAGPPTPFGDGTPPLSSGFPAYEVDEVAHGASTPPIKVTRVKKKATGAGKKKRTSKATME